MNGLRILNVNHLLDPVSGGGTAERTFQLSRFLSLAGAECTLLTLDIGVLEERVRLLKGVRLVALPCINRRFFIPGVLPSNIDGLVADADVVHLMGHWTVLNALVYRSCRRLNKPFVFCPAGGLKLFGRSLMLKWLYDAIIGRGLVREASACIAITDEERDDFDGYGIPRDRVVVIPNGIDPEDYESYSGQEFSEGLGLSNVPYILFLGRLNEIKGPDILLDAFIRIAEAFPDVHLVFAGPDDGMLQVLKNCVDRNSISGRVHFVGYVGGAKKAELLRSAKLLAIPSRREAMSIVVLEAGISATPVLYTSACGLEALAREGGGFMVESSVEGVREGLCNLLSNGEYARSCAERLLSIVRNEYLWHTQAERYFHLYSHLMAV